MHKTKTLLTAFALLALVTLFFSPAASAADEEKPKVRHPSYTMLGHDAPPAEDSPLNPNFVIAQENRVLEGSLWHGNYIDDRLVGLDVGDVDGDHRNELVYVTPNNVFLSRRNGELLEQIAGFSIPTTMRALSVDLFDTDGDGRQEIIVSCQLVGAGASSYVLSYDGDKALKVLGDYIPWYLRVIGSANSKMLAVQKSGTSGNNAYTGNVMYATFADGKISASQKVDLPFGVNLYNFNFGKMGASNQNLISTVTFPEEHLRVYSGPDRSSIVTESAAEYCGTVNYIRINTSSETGKDVEYLPSRIIVADIDNDGSNELILAKNNQGGIPFMKNLRAFNRGLIEAMKFTNLSLVPFFSSADLIPGPAVDYQLADFDNNGTRDLVIAVVISPGSGMMRSGRSVIISYSNLYSAQAEGGEPSK
jgi:microcompartment protein CcmK/EutM